MQRGGGKPEAVPPPCWCPVVTPVFGGWCGSNPPVSVCRPLGGALEGSNNTVWPFAFVARPSCGPTSCPGPVPGSSRWYGPLCGRDPVSGIQVQMLLVSYCPGPLARHGVDGRHPPGHCRWSNISPTRRAQHGVIASVSVGISNSSHGTSKQMHIPTYY